MIKKHPEYPTAVREMPEEDRPRERLARVGPEALRDAELLAILFRTGTRQMGAVALADHIINQFGNIRNLARATLEELQQIKGLGQVKAIEIKAALEFGKRLASYTDRSKTRIRTAEDVEKLLMTTFKDYEDEHFKCIMLTTKNDLMKIVDVSRGAMDFTVAVPRDVFRHAVREGAAAIIVCHNHPSGDPEPSHDDIALTERLVKSGDVLGIRVLDHVVFGDGAYISLKERNLM